MSSKSYTIFAFDGGGSKGLYSTRILERIENQTQKSALDFADMFCGTSTGSIISVGLSLGLSGAHLVDLYKTLAPQVFTKSLIDLRLPYVGKISTAEARQVFLGSKYSNVAFTKIIKDIAKDNTLGSLKNHLCIPAFDALNNTQFLFDNLNKRQIKKLKDIPLYDLILASSAAPTFLPPHTMNINDHDYVFYDGGLYANNPTLVALKQALNWIREEQKDIKNINILSFSSFVAHSSTQANVLSKQSIFTLKDDLMDIYIQAQSITTDSFLEAPMEINGIDINYYRIPSFAQNLPIKTRVDMDSRDHIALDTMIEHADSVFEQIKEQPLMKDILSS